MKALRIEETYLSVKEQLMLKEPKQTLLEFGSSIDRFETHYAQSTNSGGDLASFFIRYEAKSITYFKKGQSVFFQILFALTSIGGLIAAFTSTLACLYRVYHKHAMYVYLMGKTFVFDNYSSKDKEIDQKEQPQISLFSKQKIHYSFFLFIIVSFITLIDQISYLICDSKTSLRKCLPSKFYLYEIAKNKIKRDLGLKNILRLLYDVDKLKWLLMSQDQMIIFNSLAKPVISRQTVQKDDGGNTLKIQNQDDSQQSRQIEILKNPLSHREKNKKRDTIRHANIHEFYEEENITGDKAHNKRQTLINKTKQNFGTIPLNLKKFTGGIFDASVIEKALSARVQDAFKHLIINEGLILMTQMNSKQFKRIYGLNFEQCIDCWRRDSKIGAELQNNMCQHVLQEKKQDEKNCSKNGGIVINIQSHHSLDQNQEDNDCQIEEFNSIESLSKYTGQPQGNISPNVDLKEEGKVQTLQIINISDLQDIKSDRNMNNNNTFKSCDKLNLQINGEDQDNYANNFNKQIVKTNIITQHYPVESKIEEVDESDIEEGVELHLEKQNSYTREFRSKFFKQ